MIRSLLQLIYTTSYTSAGASDRELFPLGLYYALGSVLKLYIEPTKYRDSCGTLARAEFCAPFGSSARSLTI